MSEALVRKFNEHFAATKTSKPNLLAVSEEPFDTYETELPEIPPRTDVPGKLQGTAIGRVVAEGYPALKGTVRKYWARCAVPDDCPEAFKHVHEIAKDMPAEYNNIVSCLTRDGDSDFYMAAASFI